MEQLKKDLRERYLQTYRECRKFKYTPIAFLNMVMSDKDIVEITRQLIHKPGGTDGFTTLYMNKRMDLSVEKIILESKYRVLFSQEDLKAAYDRLKEYQYDDLNQIEAPNGN